jgi:uncharacterized protein
MLILYWALVVLMVAGIVGAAVPGIPGTSVILAAIVVWGLAVHDFAAIQWALAAAILVLILSFGIDFLATYWGAKKAGASKWGQIGAMVGLVAGLVLPLPTLPIGGPIGFVFGLLVGPWLGATVGEFLFCKDVMRSIQAGLGIVLGSLIGNLVQGFLAIAPVSVFLATTWAHIPPA